MERQEAIARLRQHRQRLMELGVTRAYLFGSVATGSATQDSDVDVMIDLDEGPGGRKPLFSAFDVGGIQYALTQILGCRVDVVVRRDALKHGKRLRDIAQSGLVDAF